MIEEISFNMKKREIKDNNTRVSHSFTKTIILDNKTD